MFERTEYAWGCDYYRETGRMMPADGLEQLRDADAIYLGAIGHPSVPDHVSIWELILPIRQRFEQYVNLRPMRLLPGVSGPLSGRGARDIDMVCVRENSEGEYAGLGGRLHRGTAHEVAEQTGLFTRMGIERVVRYAFQLARSRPRRLLASATKSNALQHSMVLWDEVVDELARGRFPSHGAEYHVDALAARMVTQPQTLDVIVASNLFGDILTDLGAAVSGSLGVAPGANLNPERRYPSMFEPIHGSAPDIAGTGDCESNRGHLGGGSRCSIISATATCTIGSSARSSMSSPLGRCGRRTSEVGIPPATWLTPSSTRSRRASTPVVAPARTSDTVSLC